MGGRESTESGIFNQNYCPTGRPLQLPGIGHRLASERAGSDVTSNPVQEQNQVHPILSQQNDLSCCFLISGEEITPRNSQKPVQQKKPPRDRRGFCLTLMEISGVGRAPRARFPRAPDARPALEGCPPASPAASASTFPAPCLRWSDAQHR